MIEFKKAKNEAEKDLEKKLQLEKLFEREIKSLFNRMRKSFTVIVAAKGEPPKATNFENAWAELLKKQYERVQKEFVGHIERMSDVETTEDMKEELLLLLLLWAEKTSKVEAEFITKTNEKNMFSSVLEANKIAAEGGQADNRTVAAIASTLLGRKFNGRVGKIAVKETQDSAEKTKFIEAETYAREISRQAVEVVKKTWVTIGDKFVRGTHQTANGQTQPIDKPFIVGGYFLKAPGDSTLGAPMKEVAGCRCSAMYGLPKGTTFQPSLGKPVQKPKPKPKPKKPIIVPPDENLSPKAKTKPALTGGKSTVKKPFKVVEPPNVDSFKKIGKPFTASEKSYTEWYSGDGFKEINDFLRNPKSYVGDVDKVESLLKYKKNLSSAIAKSETTKDMTVYRGINSKAFKKIANSKDLKELSAVGYQSASLAPGTSTSFSGFEGTVLRIKVPKGTKALNMNKYNLSSNSSEAEVLLDQGKYVVRDVSQGVEVGGAGSGIRRTILDVDYIPN